jgi:hypothetical protein
VLRRIFGPKRDEVTGGWRKLLNNFFNLYSSPSIIRIIKSRSTKFSEHVARMRKRNAYRIMVGKPVGKRPIGRPRSRWEENIKMNHKEITWYKMDWNDWLRRGARRGFL